MPQSVMKLDFHKKVTKLIKSSLSAGTNKTNYFDCCSNLLLKYAKRLDNRQSLSINVAYLHEKKYSDRMMLHWVLSKYIQVGQY